MSNFKRTLYKIAAGLMAVAFIVLAFWQLEFIKKGATQKYVPEEQKLTRAEKKAGREEYFFNLTRDPFTNSIPANIRSRELEYAKSQLSLRRKSSSALAPSQYNWESVGPFDLGGRTRALGIDQRDPNIVVTGGVSGGIWKSTDGGDTWVMKTDLDQNMSVSHLTQDPNNPDTWYYTSGEFRGNSASSRGGGQSNSGIYRGTGIYKSTDNAETWSLIPSTEDTDVSFNSPFDYTSRIMVSPTSGSVFAASNAFGLLRSTDGGTTFPILRGGTNDHSWTDFDIDSNGNIIAVFSTEGDSPSTAGIYYSTDDGASWTDVTPSGFPSQHNRSVIDFAPSNSNVAYVFTQKVSSISNQGVAFFKIDISDPLNPVTEDRSANIPNFEGSVGGMNTQSSYNMVLAVKPDDEDFVLVGGTNLFRSTDGFATAPASSSTAEKDKFWVGGYAKENDVSQYPNHHPDQHVIAFDPTNPNRVWAGHDGAISVTDNIVTIPSTWEDKDDGLITSQYYTAAIGPEENDDRVMGGTQDNGTPYFRVDGTGQQTLDQTDVSSGDGTYSHFGTTYGYVSSQGGNVFRIEYNSSGDLTSPFDGSTSTLWTRVTPTGATDQLFVHPFEVDPTDDTIMYYPGGNKIWRNTELDAIPNFISPTTSQGWEEFDGAGSGYTITTLEVSRNNVLYYGASDPSDPGQAPKIYRVGNANTSFAPQEVSIPGAPSGAYVHDIAINPVNGDEVIAVLSNYSIVGIYHSVDGGSSWSPIEGSLTGDSNNPGPSIRSATIVPTANATIYFVGTSTGLYSTETLDGANTQWTQEAGNTIGFGVVEFLDTRASDGDIVVGSHGQGIFKGTFQGTLSSPGAPQSPQNVTLSSSATEVNLEWDENTEIDFEEYRIYKGTDPSNLSLFNTITDGSSDFIDSDDRSIPIFYRISTVDDEGLESDLSDIVAAFRGTKSLNPNWQLAGSPLFNNSGLDLPESFQMVGFNGGYQVSTSFERGQGYWIKPASSDSIVYNLNPEFGLVSNNITLRQGWNMIGGISDTVAVADIKDPEDILTNPVNIKAYNGSNYIDASNIEPTDGYFIFATGSGDISLEVDTASGSSPKLVNNDGESHSFDELHFSKNGFRQSILISEKALGGEKRLSYLMPPLSPDPILDVRTSDGYSLSDKYQIDLALSVSSYPVQVKLAENSQESYRLIATDKGEKVFIDLQPGTSATIGKSYDRLQLQKLTGNEKVLTNKISPNYPNPFNPSTTIRFQIAQEAKVSLEVYNILGKKVRTLVNQVRQPGVYTERFDASNLSSGTYFMRITAGTFTDIQKMTLIK